MTSLSRFLNRFTTNLRGNVTMVVAFSVIPVVAAVGGGLDFANIQAARAKLQDAADAAAIAATLDQTATQISREAAAKKAFCANIKDAAGLQNSFCGAKTIDTLGTASGTLSSATANNILTLSYAATASVPTYLLGLVGMDTVDIDALAKAGVSTSTAEIAFVLDNTGSMSSNNKMTYLKSSLDTVLASLLDSNGNNVGKTKVALVPFDTQVALNNVASMAAYAGNFGTPTPVYTCASLSTGQCTAIMTNNSYLANWIGQNWSAAAGTMAASNVETYTRSSNSNLNVYSAAYFNNPTYSANCYNNCGNKYYRYITYYYVTTYNSSGVKNGNSSMQGYYTNNADSFTPGEIGYNNYSKYSGTISYSYPSGGGYNSGSTTVYMDNDTINSTDNLLGVGTQNWSGCVIDRTQSYDVTADAPVSNIANSLYPAAKCATNSLLPIMGLTQNIATARSYAAGMKPAGNTNVTIGVQWGMEVLSPTAPFSEGAAFTDKAVGKYMIVLTDGINTQNRWTTNNSQINARLALACTNAKNLGITVFTVRVEQGDSTTLSNCASQPAYYYNLSNANMLPTTLAKIMKSIKKVRLTR